MIKIIENLFKIVCLPTWFIAKITFKILPKQHKWKKGRTSFFTLTEWSKNSTNLCFLFDVFFWFWISFVLGCCKELLWNFLTILK